MNFVKRHPIIFSSAFLLIIFIIFIKTILLNLFQVLAPYYPWEPHWERIIPQKGSLELTINGERKIITYNPSCSNRPGTDPTFSFFYRKGKVNKLLVLFSGGGACWSGQNCIPGDGSSGLKLDGRVTYIDQIFPTMFGALQFTPAGRYGMLDYKDDENPIKDWHAVWIWSCDGSVYWGSNDKEYEDPFYNGGKHVLRHRGFDNTMSVLKFLRERLPNPEKVLVSGQSAGGYGSVMNFPYFRKAYRGASMYLLFDSSAGIVPRIADGDDYDFMAMALPKWGVQKTAPSWVTGIEGNAESLGKKALLDIVKHIGNYYPNVKIAEYNPAWDLGQLYFYHVMKNYHKKDTDWNATIYSSKRYKAISAASWCDWHNRLINTREKFTADNPDLAYHYYIAPGVHHGLGKAFDEKSNGIAFKDWLSSFIKDQSDWDNVLCAEDCQPPEEVKSGLNCLKK